jgi:hypothetical protein
LLRRCCLCHRVAACFILAGNVADK